MKYSTVSDTATRWGISPQRVQKLAFDGRIIGAIKIGRDWLIPHDSINPSRPTPGRPKQHEG